MYASSNHSKDVVAEFIGESVLCRDVIMWILINGIGRRDERAHWNQIMEAYLGELSDGQVPVR